MAGAAEGLARPELLPVRLARACAHGYCQWAGRDQHVRVGRLRIPVGASDDEAAVAERLQFTAAEGPCLDAHELARSVLATEH